MNSVYALSLFCILISLSTHAMKKSEVLAETQKIWAAFYIADPATALKEIKKQDSSGFANIGVEVGDELVLQAVNTCLVHKDKETSRLAVDAIELLYKKKIKLSKEGVEEVAFWKEYICPAEYSRLILIISR